MYTIVFPSLALLPVEERFDPTIIYYRYTPKSKRWKRLRAINKQANQILSSIWNPISSWFLSHETTWKSYKTRLKTRRKVKSAHTTAEKMQKDETDNEPFSKERWKRRRRSRYAPPPLSLFIQNAVAMDTNAEGEPIHVNVAKFDTDSMKIGIDNRCSACISYDINDFEGPVIKVNRSIKGFGGERVMNVYRGTIIWRWCDNEGVVHKFKIPNSYYVPDGHCRLLSPQHWARTQVGSSVKKLRGFGETTYADKCTLFWNDGSINGWL